MNASELFAGLAGLPGSREAGSDGNGISATRLVGGVEYALATAPDESKLRGAWKRRQGGGATPLVLVADDPEAEGFVRVLGPQKGSALRRVRADALFGLLERTASLNRLQAVRLVAEEVERLDTERIAGVRVQGLGTEHLYGTRLPTSPRWNELAELVGKASRAGWRELLTDLGYAIERLPRRGHLARASGRNVIVVHPLESSSQFARLDAEGRLPEGALVGDCQEHAAPYGILAAGTRLRLLSAGRDEAGATTRYLELDTAALEPDMAPLLGLLAPAYLAEDGLREVLGEARDYGQELRERLDLVLRQDVLPVLGVELGRWARAEGRDLADDAIRAEIETAALLFVFRALFLLYAESAGHLPMTNPTYAAKSLTRLCERAAEELAEADATASALWDDLASLVRRMRTGQRAWDLPAYNGDLFAQDQVAGALILEKASIPDAALARALVALGRDPDDPNVGVDFSGLEIGHLGYIYEGLLSLRLSLADRDYLYDERRDRYVSPGSNDETDVARGDLLWLTDEGGRKGGGVYYTRTELVRHLVRGAVGPAFDRHLDDVRAIAERDPQAAAMRLFDFYVLDPACGSAHFLVEVVDELADQIAKMLGSLALPSIREQLEALRAGAGATFGAGIEDTALLKRLVLKHCVCGVDLSPMGAEIAKLSLWLSTFVPGLSLAYLDHNIQRGNSLIGVARAEDVAPPAESGQVALFGEGIAEATAAAAQTAARLRAIDDTTPEQFQASRDADAALHAEIAGARRVFDLWTAEPLGLAGARDEALMRGGEIVGGALSTLADAANELANREAFLHWPLAFAEVFARERPGFDAVVGNPPWEEINLDEVGFFVRYRPGIRALDEGARRSAIEDLLNERPELASQIDAERARLKYVRAYFGPSTGYWGSPGNADFYKFFSQRYRSLLREGGALGVVLPRSAFLAKGSAGFREWLFQDAPPRRLDFLLNRGSWAFDMEPRYSVSLLIAERVTATDDHAFEVAGVASSATEFRAQVEHDGLRLPRSALGPNLEVPLLRSQADAELLTKLRQAGLFARGGGRWRCFPVQGDFNQTTDKALWATGTGDHEVWKGESFDQFSPHGAATQPIAATEAVLRKAAKPRPGSESLIAAEASVQARRDAVLRTVPRARVAFRDVTNRTNSRTVISCLVPPGSFLTNKAPYLAFLDDDLCAEAACLAVMNSLPFDWQARRFVEISLNFFILEGLSVPVFGDREYGAVVEAAARLSCPDDRFSELAEAAGVEAGPMDSHERTQLLASIDALVARAWELTADDLEIVFSDFTSDAVSDEYRELVRENFAAVAN